MPGPVANSGGGAGASAPVPMFKLLDLTPIHKGNLLARGRFQMPSGMIVSANVLRNRREPDKIFVLPVVERQQGGGYVQIIDFATPSHREAWQAAALAALQPRWLEVVSRSQEACNGSF